MLREDAGLAQTELANHLGVDQPPLSKWESGRRHPENQQYYEWLIEQAEDTRGAALITV